MTTDTAELAATLDAHQWGRYEWSAHARHNFHGDCAICQGDTGRITEVLVGILTERAWIVPRIAYDANKSVRPTVLDGGWIRREAGTSDPKHTRFYAGQLLAAADVAEANAEKGAA